MEDFEDFMNANPSGELPEDFKATAGKPGAGSMGISQAAVWPAAAAAPVLSRLWA